MRLVWLVLVGLSLVYTGCDQHEDAGPTLADVPPERLIAFTAVYAETLPSGAPVQRIVVADFENPEVFEVISRPDHVSVQPYLSRDRQQVLFGDRTRGVVHGPQFVRYDLRTGRADTLAHVPSGTEPPPGFDPFLVGAPWPVVWDRGDDAFFFTNPDQAFSGRRDVLRFAFADGYFERMHDAEGYVTIPLGLRGIDTLVVFSSNPGAPGLTAERPARVFYMDRAGRFLGRPENPNLTYVWGDDQWDRQVLEPSWNEIENRVAYRLVEPNPDPNAKRSLTEIVVSDADGSGLQRYDLGVAFLDRFPRWGPNGTILIDRAPYGSNDWRDHRIVVLDLASGAVREWADPAVFGAVGLRFPNMGDR